MKAIESTEDIQQGALLGSQEELSDTSPAKVPELFPSSRQLECEDTNAITEAGCWRTAKVCVCDEPGFTLRLVNALF